MDFKEQLTIISDDLNHDEISKKEAINKICELIGVGTSACKHKNTTIIPGVFGGIYCDECKEQIYEED